MRDLLVNSAAALERGVLLPGFIGWSAIEGSGVFDPVREAEVQYGFYGLNPDLSADLDEVEAQLKSGGYGVLVIIHYYGRSEPRLQELRRMADEHDVILVEDLAHGFFTSQSESSAGRFGDVLLFSLHKQFPLAEGGMALYRNAGLIEKQVGTRPDLAVEVLSYDWREIANARRRNFSVLTSHLLELPECGNEFTLLWPELSEGDVPQTLPIWVHGEIRDSIYRRMNAEGFGMVSLYHTLIQELGGAFPRLEKLSRHIINFPVHQDVVTNEIPSLVDSFRASLHQMTEKQIGDS